MNIPRMSYPQYRKARRLTHECCNYCNGNCLLLDDGEECVCVQSISYSLLCRWFKVAVLPLDAALYTEIMERSAALSGVWEIVFSEASQLPLLSALRRETQTPEQEAVGEETQGLCVEKVSPQSPGKSGPFSPCGRGSRVLIPFPPETAFTFSTKAIEWLAIRPCLWYAEQEKIKDRSGRDGRSERFTGHNNHPGRRCR